MKLQLVANPESGGGTDREAVAAGLQRHGATLTEAEPERIVVAGGDGTVGLGAARAAEAGVALAVVATGTANDFARAHDLPDDLEAALELAATGTRTAAIELGRLGDRPFVNLVSAGLAPDAARRAKPLKPFLRALAYPVGAALAALRDPALRCTVRADGREVFAGSAWQVMVACTGAFGGGAEIDATDPSDGKLDVVVIPADRRAALLGYGRSLRRGDVAELASTVHELASEVELELPGGTMLNVDGELVPAEHPTRMTVDVDAVQLVVG